VDTAQPVVVCCVFRMSAMHLLKTVPRRRSVSKRRNLHVSNPMHRSRLAGGDGVAGGWIGEKRWDGYRLAMSRRSCRRG
jgi:hypothetical protein